LALVTAGSTALVYAVGRRLLDATTGLCAAAAFTLLSLGPGVLGFTANAEHFLVLPMLGGLLLLVPGEGRSLWGVAAAGLLMGVALLMKQHGLAFVGFGGLYLLAAGVAAGRAAWRPALARCVVYAAAAAVPLGLICLLLAAQGVFRPFWFWTFTYAREYVSIVPLSSGLELLWEQVARQTLGAWALYALATVGITALYW